MTGITGENGWYGEYGTGAPVQGVRAPGDKGIVRSNVVCFVVCADGELNAGSYARRGSVPPVRTAEGALGRENWPDRGDVGNVTPGLGELGSEGNRVALGLGELGNPTRGVVDRSDVADTGSTSVGAWESYRE